MGDRVDLFNSAFDSELAGMAEDLAKVQSNADYSETYKAKQAADIRARSEATLRATAARLVQEVDGAAVEADRAYQAAAADYDKSFDHTRLVSVAGETSAKLASATPAQVAATMDAARVSGDSHRIRATRRAALERAQAIVGDLSQSRVERMVANRIINALAAEGDTTPEVEAARERADAAKFRANLIRGKVKDVGERIKPRQFLDRSFFADALGEEPAGRVVWHPKDGKLRQSE